MLAEGNDNDIWAYFDGPISKRRLRVQSREYAATFARARISEGTTVALQMAPSVAYLATLFGLWSVGATVVLVDYRVPQAECRTLVDLADPQFVVVGGDRVGRAVGFQHDVEAGAPVVHRRSGGRAGRPDIRLVQFSSGSTGVPKIIGRSPESILAELDRHLAVDGLPVRGERILLLNSISHTMGLISGVLHALNVGAAVVFPTSLRPNEVARTIAAAEVHAVYGVPAHFELLSQVAQPPPTPSLRLAVCGGELLPRETYDAFHRRYGVRIGQVYGLTEIGLVAAAPLGTAPPPAVGTPVPGVDIELVEQEMRIRMAMSPYLGDGLSDRFTDGALRTFDRFEQDAAGVLRILGRADSLVVIGGLKVDLMEVEAVLSRHPAIAEVVVMFGESIEAFIAGTELPGSNELTAWCRERLAPVKIPRRFIRSERLPRNATGKLIRNRDLIHSDK
ncbi:class I adenylate-forming enzyme family protein [Alloactinosynnema sp. L-07]|uniref:class I adenylate-forming enzyme family protein n=1 Tax=Alloactinosynnema sp. L-07 TaxID=1653480 RepID=UPI00156070A0|nr:AMP-binding protein [Alloactinosynnema sp. L-07]